MPDVAVMNEWLVVHGAEAAAVVVALAALLLSILVDVRARRWRREDVKREQERFAAQNQPVVMVKPRFDLRSGDNHLVLEVSNLHSEVSVLGFTAKIFSTVTLDGKTERQAQTVGVDAIPPSSTREIVCGGFFCDLDSFVANIGEERFSRSLANVDREKEIGKLRELGYLRNGQPSIGQLRIEWTYSAAQVGAQPVRGAADYPLEPWQYDHGVFLSLARSSGSDSGAAEHAGVRG